MSDAPHSQEDAFGLPPAEPRRRFFFDIREGARFVPDDVGLELPSVDAAEREAARTAAEIGRDLLPDGSARSVAVEVRDDRGQRVTTAVLTLAIDRAPPEPPAWGPGRR